MSIVVMGMEMPETCEVCKMCTEVGTDLHCTLVDDKSATLVAGAYWRKIDNGETTRPDWCPLVELPEKHGRLILDNGEEYEING